MKKKNSKLIKFLRKYLVLPTKILRIAIFDTVKQDGVEHAGYLAFLSILCLFPFLIFLITIIGLIGESQAGAHGVQYLLDIVPKQAAEALAPRIHEITSGPPQSFLTIAIIGVIWTASSSVEGCRTILNRAYRIHFPPPYLWRRMISIFEFFVIIVVIVIGLVTLVVVPNLLEQAEKLFSVRLVSKINYDLLSLRYFAIFFLLTCTTSLLYYALPNAKQKFSQTVPGSLLAVTLWFCLQYCFVLYLENFHQFNFVYGSLAGVIVALMFFYLVSLIFILGAEFNYHFHRTYHIFLKKK